MFCVEVLENSYCFIHFKCIVVFVIFIASSTSNVLPMTVMMKLDWTEVEEDFSYKSNIYEIVFGFGD